MTSNFWQEDELLLALHLYCCIPFEKFDKKNPEIINLSKIINRTPDAVAMKLSNFASLDEGVSQKGLVNTSKADRDIWNAFKENSSDIAEKAEALYESRVFRPVLSDEKVSEPKNYAGETETIRERKVRLVQTFFRREILGNYKNSCAISGLAIPELLVASHIIPWSENVARRADPTNGIALNALYDKAFDRHLITFDCDLKMILAPVLKQQEDDEIIREYFLKYEGKRLNLPYRFKPDINAINIHRTEFLKIRI